MRAAAEQIPATSVLRQLVEENLDSVYKIRQLASPQPGLTEICLGFLMVSGRAGYGLNVSY